MKTPRTLKLPPFHTQIVGSFPRPAVVLDLLTRRHEFTPERFMQIQDDLVRFAIRTQGLTGLDVVSDGQWRGASLLAEFRRRVGGFEPLRKITHQGQTKVADVVVQRMNPTGSVYKADADFLVNNTARLTKFAIPSPAGLAVRYWHPDHSKGAYPTRQHFMDHLVAILSAEVHHLMIAGIDIIQIDDTALLNLCSPPADGEPDHECTACEWSIEAQIIQTLSAINRLADCALGKTEFHLHCCRGRCQSRSDAPVDYKPLLTRLKEVRIDRLNLGFAFRGKAGLEDLALLPPHIDLGMGVLDVRSGVAPSVEDIQALALAGAAILPRSRLALNPDCGLGSDAPDAPTLDQAYDKLRRLTAAAKGLRAKHS